MAEDDAAGLACLDWIRAWRDGHRTDPRPPMAFGTHLGREAVEMMNGDVSRVEMRRIFSAAGFDGLCVCGKKPGDS